MSFNMVKPNIIMVGTVIYFGSMVFLPIIMFINGLIKYGLILLILWLFAFWGIINQCILKKIVINEYGIKYKTLLKCYEMSWEEIKIIGIGYIPIKAPGKPPWIYFDASGVSNPMLNARMISEKYFMAHYRKPLEDEIRKYWKGSIDGLDDISDFERLHKSSRKLT